MSKFVYPIIPTIKKSYWILDFLTPRLSGGTREPIGSKIDFKGDPIFETAPWFFVIILKFIFTFIFEIKINEKNFLTSKKFHSRRPIFNNNHIFVS